MSQRSIRSVVLSLAALSLLVPAPARAQPAPGAFSGGPQAQVGPFNLSLGASIGQVGGKATELAFAYPRGEKFKLSELTWDIKDVAVAGLQARIGIGSRFTVSLGASRALNEGSGSMRDRDWLYTAAIDQGLIDAADITDADWTHESRHPDTTVDDGTMFDVNLSFQALQTGPFALSLVLGYRQDDWEWSSRGGTYVYSVDGFRDRGGSFKNPDGSNPLVIIYEQKFQVPYVGLAAAYEGPAVQVEAHVRASGMVRATDRDYHVLRDTLFAGDFAGGAWFGAGCSATWEFLPRWYALAVVEYQKHDGMTGDMTVDTPEGRWLFVDGGGVALETVTLLFGAGVRF